MTQAKPGDTVRIHYTGKLTDGTQFDSSVGGEPLQFQLGAGQIITGLEKQVEGMAEGEKATVTVPAAEAYGEREEAQVQNVPRTMIPEEIDLQPGLQLQATTKEGGQLTLTVVEAKDDEVTVDANHPLAGKDLVFDVEIVEIVQAA